jgi:hypothetical protein
MDPQQQFCPNEGCRAYGRKAEGYIVIHSSAEQCYQWKRCKKTFSATKATAFYRIHKPHELVLMVLTLLAHGSALFKRSWPLLASTSALWPAGKERPERTAKGRMSTS